MKAVAFFSASVILRSAPRKKNIYRTFIVFSDSKAPSVGVDVSVIYIKFPRAESIIPPPHICGRGNLLNRLSG